MSGYVSIAPLPAVPSIQSLTYEVPDGMEERAIAGVRALVPLGRRKITGLVLGSGEAPGPDIACRPIVDVLDSEPVVTADVIELSHWIASYYLCSVSDALSLAIGRGLTSASRKTLVLVDASKAESAEEKAATAALNDAGGSLPATTLCKRIGASSPSTLASRLERRGIARVESKVEDAKVRPRFAKRIRIERLPTELETQNLFARAPKRRAVFEYLLDRPDRSATADELASLIPAASAPLAVLAEAGIVSIKAEEAYREIDVPIEPDTSLTLTDDQASARDAIAATLGEFQPFLLHGVTASGKTEVYLRILESVLERDEGALVLVPEISLTHQIVARLTARFGATVAVLHSELSAGERFDEWRRIARGEARIAVGARSAVLAPVERLGLVVVDEEHDSSYKQDDGVRYNARDVAVVRARTAGCPIVLGSATPSLESWNNAQQERYRLVELPDRVTGAEPPSVEVVDLRGRDILALGGIGEHLTEQMRRNFEAGGQTLLFLNRRGYAAALSCYECGASQDCPNCSVGMTVHTTTRELRCHHCDARSPYPERCAECGADALMSRGLGTQRLEATVRQSLPAARVARLDRDAAGRKGETGRILARWRAGEIDVLIGTQMITKGHDVAGVTLVGVIQADLALSVPDFRASERTYQLLAQVAGRAGRSAERGRVIVQTYQPDHPAVQAAARHDFHAFADVELEERDALGYPPAGRLALLRFSGPDRNAVARVAAAAARMATGPDFDASVLTVRGPAPCAIERVQGRYRQQLQLRSASGAAVRTAAAQLRARLVDSARNAKVRVAVDIDPVDML